MCCRSEWQERMYIYKWHGWPDKTWNILWSYCLQWNTSQSKFRNHYFLFVFAFSILSQLFLIWGCVRVYIYIYIYILGVARYMYSSRTVTVQASRFGAWGLTTNTGNSPTIQKGAPAAMQCCLITASRRTANANGDTEAAALMFVSLYFILIKYQLAVKLAMLELMCERVCVCVCASVPERSLQLFPYTSRINFKHLLSY